MALSMRTTLVVSILLRASVFFVHLKLNLGLHLFSRLLNKLSRELFILFLNSCTSIFNLVDFLAQKL